MVNEITTYQFASPAGNLLLRADEASLHVLHFVSLDPIQEKAAIDLQMIPPHNIIQQTVHQLKEYFDGFRRYFDIPLSPAGTAFQLRVWEALQQIPYAKTISYQQLAISLGDVKSIRAAGTANGKNPIAIIIPCHRVIGANGALVGYGGGIWRKNLLLELESRIAYGTQQLF